MKKSVSATHKKTANGSKERRSSSPDNLSRRPSPAKGMHSAGETRDWEDDSHIPHHSNDLPHHTTSNTLLAFSHPSAPQNKTKTITHTLGFQHPSTSILFLIFAGTMLTFTLFRSPFLNITGSAPSSFKSAALPGEWYSYRSGPWLTGLKLHLRAALPCGFLMIWQFIPRIRKHAPALHRVNGYAVILLAIISNVGALMICRRSLGGGLDVQSAVVALAVASTTAMAIAYYHIRRMRVQRHREWMLRAVFYLGSIVTTRAIMVVSAVVISKAGGYYQVQSCKKIAFINGGEVDKIVDRYPGCAGQGASVAVPADMKSGLDEQLAAALGLSFGMALWVALLLHAVGVEVFLGLTSGKGKEGEYQLRGEIENWS